jgi:DNA-binding NarL/FixJ family response regulator
MSKPLIQIDDLVREMTIAEYDAYQEQQLLAESEKLEKQQKVAARESALAKLAALGLTEEEIAAL